MASMTANGLYSDRARNMFGMAPSAATSTTSPQAVLERGMSDNLSAMSQIAKFTREQVTLLKTQVKLLTEIKNGQSSWGITDALLTGIIGRYTAKLFGGFGAVGVAITGGIVATGGVVKNIFSGIVGSVARGVKDLFGGLLQTVPRLVASVGRPVKALLTSLSTISTGVLGVFSSGLLGSVSKVAGIIGRIGSKFLFPLVALLTAFDAFKGYSNADEILGRDAVGIVGKIGSAISTAVNGLLLGIPDWISDKLGFKNFAQMLDNGGLKVAEFTGKLVDSVKGTFSTVTDTVIGFVSNIGTNIIDVISNAWEAVKIKMAALGTELVKWVNSFNPFDSSDAPSPRLGYSLPRSTSLPDRSAAAPQSVVRNAPMVRGGPTPIQRYIAPTAPPPVLPGTTTTGQILKLSGGGSVGNSLSLSGSVLLTTNKGVSGISAYELSGNGGVGGVSTDYAIPNGGKIGGVSAYELINGGKIGGVSTYDMPPAGESLSLSPKVAITENTPEQVVIARVANKAIDAIDENTKKSNDLQESVLDAIQNLANNDKGMMSTFTDFLDQAYEIGKKTLYIYNDIAKDLALSGVDALAVMQGNPTAGNAMSGGFTGNGASGSGGDGAVTAPGQIPSIPGLPSASGRSSALDTPPPGVQGAGGPLQPDASGKVNPTALYNGLRDKVANSKLNGFVPPDGAAFGITKGTPEEWARFMLANAKQESGLDTNSTNLSDPGGSFGLFQFNQSQFGLNGNAYDPNASADAMVKATEHYAMNPQGNKYGTGIGALGATFSSIRDPNKTIKHLDWANKIATGTAADPLANRTIGAYIQAKNNEPGVVLQPNIGSSDTIRNKPVNDKLHGILSTSSGILGLGVEVGSGGQDEIGRGYRRTGSTRHDLGGAGDIKLFRTGPDGKKQYLSMNNPSDRATMQKFVSVSAALGATGIGAGNEYMGDKTMHVGFGTQATWGSEGQGGFVSRGVADAGKVDVGAIQTAMGINSHMNNLNNAYTKMNKEIGVTMGEGVAEALHDRPSVPSFTPITPLDPITPSSPPVAGSINSQDPTGKSTDSTKAPPSTKDISSIDEYSMLLVNSSVMA